MGEPRARDYIRNVSFRDMRFANTSKSGNIKSLDLYQGARWEDTTFENFLEEDVTWARRILINEDGQDVLHTTKKQLRVHTSKGIKRGYCM